MKLKAEHIRTKPPVLFLKAEQDQKIANLLLDLGVASQKDTNELPGRVK